MSRSVRHTPIIGVTTARSEKTDKKCWSKRNRARQEDALRHARELPLLGHKNAQEGAKDGKRLISPNEPQAAKLLRK